MAAQDYDRDSLAPFSIIARDPATGELGTILDMQGRTASWAAHRPTIGRPQVWNELLRAGQHPGIRQLIGPVTAALKAVP